MIQKLHTILWALVMAAIAAACAGHTNAADDITMAEEALRQNDIELARSMCESAENALSDTTRCNVTDLCRLSMLFMHISEIDRADENTLSATRYYNRAMKLNPDSATEFYNNVDADRAAHVQIMMRLNLMLTGVQEIYADDDSLSAPVMEPLASDTVK